jgi:exodeoxyribonuclease VII small subunit
MSEMNFEAAFKRLEAILERMNSGSVSLDESLKLYEEADLLIRQCQGKLTAAEKKVMTLIKNRQGELAVEPSGAPMTRELPPLE